MKEWQWTIELSAPFHYEQGGICVDYNGTAITVEAFFTFSEKPLTLSAEGSGTAVFVYRPYRIELWLNGELIDEEWQAGEAGFTADSMPFAVSEAPAKKEQPAVVGKIEGSVEGWRPEGKVFVGDCMPYADGGRYHVLWLKDRRHHKSKWGLGAHQWEHMSTADFAHWDVHPIAVEITEPWEGSICTGSFLAAGEKQYLYYTVRMYDRSPAPISRSVSTDGVHFVKDTAFRLKLSDRYHGPSARDPKIVRIADGWHMFVTTTDLPTGRGALAHLVSADGENWRETEPIYLVSDNRQPECPDFFFFKGYYYLIFSLKGQAHYLRSREFLTQWEGEGTPIPCGRVPKGAIYGDRLIFTGFTAIEGYAGTMTMCEADADESGALSFKPFVWGKE